MNLNFGSADAMDKFEELFDLNATGEEQDWEIELADSGKLNIFVEAYESLPLTPDEKITLMLLIVASFDDALVQGWESSEVWERIEKLFSQDWELHLLTVEYWACLENEISDAFACATFMRSLLHQRASGL